jgi:hypothetical protein
VILLAKLLKVSANLTTKKTPVLDWRFDVKKQITLEAVAYAQFHPPS